VHIRGYENIVADTLSRNVAKISSITSSPATFDLIGIANSQSNSNIDFSKYKSVQIGNKIVFCEVSQPNPRPVIPPDLRSQIFQFLHGLAHQGCKTTVKLIGSRYFWPFLKTDVHKWCTECLDCQQSKIGRHPTKRFTDIHLDIVGPLEVAPGSNWNQPRYLITMLDSHTRWLEAIPVSDISAETVCKCFVFHWVARFGPPLNVTTDKGSQFTSELIKNLTELLGIHQIRTCAYNPKANGKVERCHRTLKAALKARGGNWVDQLPMVLLGLRTRPDSNGHSPYSRVTGEQPLLPHVLTGDSDVEELTEELSRMSFPYSLPRTRKVEDHFPKDMATCQFVWLRLDRIRKPLEAPYQGPFKVLERRGSTYIIEDRGKPVSVSIERLKPAKLPPKESETNPVPSSQTKIEASTPQEQGDSETRTHPVTETSREDEATGPKTVTRSGRNVSFKNKPDYLYF